jgi:predicted Rossmann fold flavoprotein
MEKTYDILIAGAGASGLAAAVEAGRADPSLSIALAEREDRVGKKILVTGNGRCNLYNERSEAGDYVPSALRYPGVLRQLAGCGEFFSSLGLLTWTDAEGRVYPHSNQASAVLNLLRQETERLGAEEVCGFAVADVRKDGDVFLLTSSDGRSLKGRKLILAAGSPAGRKREENGGLYRQLEKLGHPVFPFRPALCPLETDPSRVRSLRGVRARAAVTLERDGRPVAGSRGEVQFSDEYLGGICVMDLSALAERGDVLSLDLLPEMEERELEAYLKDRAACCGTAEQVLSGCLQKALALLALKDGGIRPAAAAPSLGGREVRELARTVKALRFPVTGFPGPARAQVCLGGVSPDSLDGETLESLKTEGLYVCGELLGVTGRCGGFNLAWAWSSGRVAGRNAALG